MFELPQPNESPNETKDGLPIVDLAEESAIVEKMLWLCYPVSAVGLPELDTLDEVQLLLQAANKYDMEGLEEYIRKELVAPRFGEKEPLRVFAIACRYRLAEEAQIAARYTLHQPISQRQYVGDLEFITAGNLHRLQDYYFECSAVAKSVAISLGWFPYQVPINPYHVASNPVYFGQAEHSCGQYEFYVSVGQALDNIIVRQWFWDYLQTLGEALEEKPWGGEAKRPELGDEHLRKTTNCPKCGPKAFGELRAFTNLLAAEVDRVVSEVSTHYEWPRFGLTS